MIFLDALKSTGQNVSSAQRERRDRSLHRDQHRGRSYLNMQPHLGWTWARRRTAETVLTGETETECSQERNTEHQALLRQSSATKPATRGRARKCLMEASRHGASHLQYLPLGG